MPKKKISIKDAARLLLKRLEDVDPLFSQYGTGRVKSTFNRAHWANLATAAGVALEFDPTEG